MKSTPQKKRHSNADSRYTQLIDLAISVLLGILAAISVLLFFIQARELTQTEDATNGIIVSLILCSIQSLQNFPHIEIWIFLALLVIIIFLVVFYVIRLKQIHKNAATQKEYNREKKINAVNRAVFESLNQVNMSKARETLRYTYGCVPEWNPIDYHHNILLYDVHEQIRSILIYLKQVVISLDPSRFNDQNVSVELVYCYPGDDLQKGNLPYQPQKLSFDNPPKNNEQRGKRIWKLISSGDTSGNHSKVIQYLENPTSFYTLLDYRGIIFANNKFENILDENHVDSFRAHLLRSGYTSEYIISNNFYSPDTKDIEHSPTGAMAGSAAGAVINIKNDDPEETFVKAILTINTYGEAIHVPEQKRWRFQRTPKEDACGMTVDDYSTLFRNTILGTYITLLASELSQMYIRHAIRDDKICILTGRSQDSEDDKCTLKIKDCLQCQKECKRNGKGCNSQAPNENAQTADHSQTEGKSNEDQHQS